LELAARNFSSPEMADRATATVRLLYIHGAGISYEAFRHIGPVESQSLITKHTPNFQEISGDQLIINSGVEPPMVTIDPLLGLFNTSRYAVRLISLDEIKNRLKYTQVRKEYVNGGKVITPNILFKLDNNGNIRVRDGPSSITYVSYMIGDDGKWMWRPPPVRGSSGEMPLWMPCSRLITSQGVWRGVSPMMHNIELIVALLYWCPKAW